MRPGEIHFLTTMSHFGAIFLKLQCCNVWVLCAVQKISRNFLIPHYTQNVQMHIKDA